MCPIIFEYNWTTPIILISPSKSIPRVIIDYPIEMTFRHNTFNTLNKLKKNKCPIKIFHGLNDDVIPYSHSVDIFNNLQIKNFLPTYYKNIGNNDILNVITMEDYQQVLNYKCITWFYSFDLFDLFDSFDSFDSFDLFDSFDNIL